MDHQFHYDSAEYHDRVTHVAARLTLKGIAPRSSVTLSAIDSNSYHGAAIRNAEQERLDRLYPRLRR